MASMFMTFMTPSRKGRLPASGPGAVIGFPLRTFLQLQRLRIHIHIELLADAADFVILLQLRDNRHNRRGRVKLAHAGSVLFAYQLARAIGPMGAVRVANPRRKEIALVLDL